MAKGILETILIDMVEENTKLTFINKMHNKTGIDVNILGEVYSRGLNSASESNPSEKTLLAKARVYSFIKEGSEDSDLRKKLRKQEETDDYDKKLKQFRFDGPFRIWDNINKGWVGKPYKDRRRAQTRADKLDNEYGAYRYNVVKLKDD